ncbi:MAG TPA: nucleotidyltransferase family protein [Thermoanaerobaculia bacterium]|nr:nucleotidyltransferase family protein [Thermoanaerobaculia bacterium]
MSVSAVLLAAGASTRFGSPKMLAPVPPDGRPMLAHVVDTWRVAGFAEIVVVLGSGAREIREKTEEDLLRMRKSRGGAGARDGRPDAGDGAAVRFVENLDWESGMFSSVRAGLAAIRPESTHAALSPADLPFLRTSSLRAVLSATNLPEADSRTLLVPVCGLRRGHPLLIPAFLVARVLSWPADDRLNRLFAEPDVKVLPLEGFDETVLLDVDRPADLAAAVSSGARA